MDSTKENLQLVLVYDTCIGSNLTVVDRISIHQFMRQKVPLSNAIKLKIAAIIGKIKYDKWKPPEIKYNPDRVLVKYDKDLEKYITIKKE